jgi:ABC-2 type transport system ATP-binding protein
MVTVLDHHEDRGARMANIHAVVDCEDLRKAYGDVEALRGVSLAVKPGEVLALLGSNGSGKTTTVRTLTTQISLDSGSAKIAGHDVSREGASARRAIGVTNQETRIDAFMTGTEHMSFTARLRHVPRSRRRTEIPALLEEFDLTEKAGQRTNTYSGGMRRRLDLASSLIGDPPVWFLDEPSNGLDPHNRQRLWEAIRRRARNGTAVLLTTQYMEEADALADEIVVLANGEVLATGSPNDLKDDIKGRTVELTFEEPQVVDLADHLLTRRGIRGNRLDDDPLTLRFVHLPTDGSLLDLLQHLKDQSATVQDLIIRRPTLDEAFLHLTEQGKAPASQEALR